MTKQKYVKIPEENFKKAYEEGCPDLKKAFETLCPELTDKSRDFIVRPGDHFLWDDDSKHIYVVATLLEDGRRFQLVNVLNGGRFSESVRVEESGTLLLSQLVKDSEYQSQFHRINLSVNYDILD